MLVVEDTETGKKWELDRLTIPKQGDYYLSLVFGIQVVQAKEVHEYSDPQIILRPVAIEGQDPTT